MSLWCRRLELRPEHQDIAISGIVIFLLGTLTSLGILVIQAGVVGSVVSAGFGAYSQYRQPRVRLSISNFRIVGLEAGPYRLYQVRATVTNKGRRIAENVTAQATVKGRSSQPRFLTIRATVENKRQAFEASEMNRNMLPCILETATGLPAGGSTLRLGESIDAVFPKENLGVEYRDGFRFQAETITAELWVRGDDPVTKETRSCRKTKEIQIRSEEWPKYWIPEFAR